MAKTIVGIVSSDKADKTITVTIRTRQTHPIYRKQFSVNKKLLAHDEKNEAKLGDKVSIEETRPISKRKSFKLTSVLERPEIREDQAVEAVTEDVAEEPVPEVAQKKVKDKK